MADEAAMLLTPGVWFSRIDGTWLIPHDQVSVPVDFESGSALLDLEP